MHAYVCVAVCVCVRVVLSRQAPSCEVRFYLCHRDSMRPVSTELPLAVPSIVYPKVRHRYHPHEPSLMLPSDSPMAPCFHEQISLAGDFTTPGFRHGSSRPIPEAVVSRVNLFRRQLRTEHRSNFVSVVFESLRHGTPLAGGDVKRALEECVDTSVSADATLLRSMLAATALLENGTLWLVLPHAIGRPTERMRVV